LPQGYSLLTLGVALLYLTQTCIRDTLNPVERDELLSIGGSLTMFPQEPHSYVGGCTNTLTQTTQVQTCCALPVARVLGYYYVSSLAIEHGSLSLALPLWGQFVDTLVLQVYAWITHQHVRRLSSKRNTSMPCMSGRMQANGLVPYLLSATNTVIRVSSSYLFYHRGQKVAIPLVPKPQTRNSTFIPIPSREMGLPVPLC
jgi:hypothetical protein